MCIRDRDYYTGTVYETTLLDHPEIGSVCSGGRYDNLAEYYTDRPLPGVGISIGLTRLFYVLNEQGMLNENRVMAPADVMIVPMTDDLEAAVRLATELRAQNIRVQLYAEQKKFKAKIQYADKLHIPYMIVKGSSHRRADHCPGAGCSRPHSGRHRASRPGHYLKVKKTSHKERRNPL